MRFLGVGDYCDLAALYLRLLEEGHEVKVFIGDASCRGILDGLATKTRNWREELPWIRAAGADGVILFESVASGSGSVQDSLRSEGLNVVGGGAFGDRLENDRAYAQRLLRAADLSVAGVWEFRERRAALDFLKDYPGRYVLKFNGANESHKNYVGRLEDGKDVGALLQKLPDTHFARAGFILMEYVEGVEMGVGAYFNGEKFLLPACLDWEHKRFFAGDLGELTGEMGTVATFQRSQSFFERTLLPIENLLRVRRHCGYVNLNTIVNERGIWPLEFTCRFGYPGFAVLTPLQTTQWSELLKALTRGSETTFSVREEFCVGVVLTTPPFPYSASQTKESVGLPVMFDGRLSAEDCRNLHFCELASEDGQLVTAGNYGWTMVATGVGGSVAGAQRNAYGLADRVLVPNLRYRRDIGNRLIETDYDRVERLGLLDWAGPREHRRAVGVRSEPIAGSIAGAESTTANPAQA